jgi:hypothetical protein
MGTFTSPMAVPSRAPSAPVTDFLHAWSRGDRAALDSVIPLVHAELKRLARRRLADERRNHTIQPTALASTRPMCAWSTNAA